MKKAIFLTILVLANIAVFGQNVFNSTGNAGIGTTSPPYSLSLASTTTGIAQYNTADMTTSPEQFHQFWSENQFIMQTEKGGGGTLRGIRLGVSSTRTINITNTGNSYGIIYTDFGSFTSTNASGAGYIGTYAATSGMQSALALVPTVGQSSTAGYRGLWISPYEQTLGSGKHYLVDVGTNTAASGSGTHTSKFIVDNTGNVFIPSGNLTVGTTDSKGYMFAVNGSAVATSMTVKLNSNWPDYVFKKDYQLPALADVKAYIDQNHHLPDMPSAAEVVKEGLNLGETNKQLTKKVEELTLYTIEKDEQIKAQQNELNEIKGQLRELTEQIKQMQKQNKKP